MKARILNTIIAIAAILTFGTACQREDFLLPEGSVEDVKKEVAHILDVMGDRGGYILSPAHTIQPDVPAANVIAVYHGAQEYYKQHEKEN